MKPWLQAVQKWKILFSLVEYLWRSWCCRKSLWKFDPNQQSLHWCFSSFFLSPAVENSTSNLKIFKNTLYSHIPYRHVTTNLLLTKVTIDSSIKNRSIVNILHPKLGRPMIIIFIIKPVLRFYGQVSTEWTELLKLPLHGFFSFANVIKVVQKAFCLFQFLRLLLRYWLAHFLSIDWYQTLVLKLILSVNKKFKPNS